MVNINIPMIIIPNMEASGGCIMIDAGISTIKLNHWTPG
jgi:hypothetical protein